MINSVLEQFDFEQVRKVMTYLNWTWWDDDEPPSIYSLVSTAERLLRDVTDEDEQRHMVGSGGFYAIADRDYNGKLVGLRLYFSIAEGYACVEDVE